MAMTPSTEVLAYDPEMFPNLLDQDPAEVRVRFARRFATASTIEDLFAVLDGNTSKDLVGAKLQIRSVAWAPYESDRGVIPNAICDAVDLDTGEMIEFATTSEVLTMFIRRAEVIGALPFDARLVGKKTRQGQTALNFEQI